MLKSCKINQFKKNALYGKRRLNQAKPKTPDGTPDERGELHTKSAKTSYFKTSYS
jgi:hypothetical protein